MPFGEVRSIGGPPFPQCDEGIPPGTETTAWRPQNDVGVKIRLRDLRGRVPRTLAYRLLEVALNRHAEHVSVAERLCLDGRISPASSR